MAHVRAQIRDAVVDALTGLTTTADRVYSGRTRPLKADHEPSLLVYAISERSQVHSQGGSGGAKLIRDLTLAVEGRVVMAGIPDDILDTIAAEVETALVSDPSLGGLSVEVTLLSTAITTLSPGESHAGEVRLEYRVVYVTRESAPETVA